MNRRRSSDCAKCEKDLTERVRQETIKEYQNKTNNSVVDTILKKLEKYKANAIEILNKK